MFVALLAGANHMPWHTFLWHNALGGICWAGGYAFCTYMLGNEVLKLSGPVGIGFGVCAIIIITASFLFLKRNEKRLTEEALKAAENDERLRIIPS